MATSSGSRLIMAFLVLGLGTAPVLAHQGVAGYRADQMHAVHAWARVNQAPGRPITVYFTLHNESDTDDTLLGATTPLANRVEIHQHMMKDGVMRMPRLKTVDIAAQDMLKFEPGGYHLMLFDVTLLPKPGSHFPLTLKFQHSKPQTLSVAALALTAKVDMSMDHKHP